nr:substrate-binding domain-containing protein [Paenibacillus andongensis]
METFGECPPLLPRVIIPDIRIIKSMLVQGKGVSVMTDDMIKVELFDGALKELWVPTNPITNEVWLAYRTIDHINPTIMKFVERCTNTPLSHKNRSQYVKEKLLPTGTSFTSTTIHY